MKRNPGADCRRIANSLALPMAVVRSVMGGAKPEAKRAGGRSLSEFRSVYDKEYIVPKRIREGLKALGAGWEYEAEFTRQIGVRSADLATYRDMFADHIVNIRSESKRAWAGTVATAKQMREMV
jgi:hypothetical protein